MKLSVKKRNEYRKPRFLLNALLNHCNGNRLDNDKAPPPEIAQPKGM